MKFYSDELLEKGENGTFDFCFIDADKLNYPNYYEKCLELLRSGGIISLDNAFLGGSVVEADRRDFGDRTRIMDDLNRRIQNDTRVDSSLLPMADGLMLVFKK